MNKRLVAAGVAVAALVGTGGVLGWRAMQERPPAEAVQSLPDEADDAAEPLGDVETVGADAPPAVDAGSTPMNQRAAVLGLLNKRNGLSRDVTLQPGQAVRLGDTIIRLRACERTAPWEAEQLTGAFVQFDVRGADERWRRAFSGWLFKERPALNVVQHPVYDVWIKSCTTSFPDTGPGTVSLGGDASAPTPNGPSGGRSSARKSPAPAPATPREPSAPARAALSNDT
jgi:hypothetical protein